MKQAILLFLMVLCFFACDDKNIKSPQKDMNSFIQNYKPTIGDPPIKEIIMKGLQNDLANKRDIFVNQKGIEQVVRILKESLFSDITTDQVEAYNMSTNLFYQSYDISSTIEFLQGGEVDSSYAWEKVRNWNTFSTYHNQSVLFKWSDFLSWMNALKRLEVNGSRIGASNVHFRIYFGRYGTTLPTGSNRNYAGKPTLLFRGMYMDGDTIKHIPYDPSKTSVYYNLGGLCPPPGSCNPLLDGE